MTADKEKKMKVHMRFLVHCLLLQFCIGSCLATQRQKNEESVLSSSLKNNASTSQRHKRAALADPRRLWDNATIPYDIDPILPEYSVTILKLSMREWEKATCLSFVKKSPSDVNFVHFTRTDCGCCTPVGNKRNGSQFFSISPNCSQMGNIMHELGHTIGFYHEQSRPDRDKYVRIHFENIDKHLQHNFKLYKDLDSLGEPYDFDSIMHYPLSYPARGGKTFMSVINNNNNNNNSSNNNNDKHKHSYAKVGQRSILSSGDIRQTNKLYRCPECGKTLTKNSGCLSYNGDDLDTKHKSKKFFGKEFCQWRILASSSDIIELRITRVRIPKNGNCSSYLMIKDGYFHSPVLKKICGASMKMPKIIRSTGSRMFIEFKLASGARFWTPGWSAQHRALSLKMLDGTSGNFTSPGFPNFYPFLKLCHYLIRSPNSTVIKLSFHTVEIGEDELCEEEFIEVRDGEYDDARSLGRFCGKQQNKNFTSTSNTMLVIFKSFTSTNFQGFSASYVAGTKKKLQKMGKKTQYKEKDEMKSATKPSKQKGRLITKNEQNIKNSKGKPL